MWIFKLNRIFLFIFCILFINITHSQKNPDKISGWKELPTILKKIIAPKFPNKVFNITKFGAIGDCKTDCTQAIENAIKKCEESGGGIVQVPKGTFLTGAIHLKSNVNLFISKNGVLKFSTDPKKYLPVVFTRWEGVECYNYSSLIYAYEQDNIAITGEGTLDGMASDDNWWIWKSGKTDKSGQPSQTTDRDKLMEMGQKGIPVKDRIFGEGHFLRPNFIQFYKCKNILIKGVTINNSPMWVIHPVLSKNISVIKVKVDGPGPNTDGCNPESCTDVLIKNCTFNTGDDCIAIKSGRNNDGRRVNVPSENIIIQGCRMKEGHGGVVIGSEISGCVRNVFAENCFMDSPNLDRAVRIKTNSYRGGIIENIYVRKIKIGQVAEAAILVDFFYGEGDTGEYTPIVRNIFIDKIKCNKSPYAFWMKAYKRSPINNIIIKDCAFNNVEKQNYLENVNNLKLINVRVNGKIISDK